MRAPRDQGERDRVIRERDANVLIDAGAGTGKTTLIVSRLLGLLAPSGDHPALPIERVAAVTFTRRAAGELRLRIRQRLLESLATTDLDDRTRGRLRRSIASPTACCDASRWPRG
jgi:ATP-dependent exoDNAse (exonuclease V) beta subunit